MILLIATRDGFALAQEGAAGWQLARRSLAGRHLTCLIARQGVILAGSTDGVFRSDDLGQSWRPASKGLTTRHVRWLAFHPEVADCEFAGTEPAAIFQSRDGGRSWQEKPEVAALRQRFGWWLPYSDGAGCVRGFAFRGQRAYAAVEVGGALRSDDGGGSWQLAPGSDGQPRFGRPESGRVHPDVHSVTIGPNSPDAVLAPTGGGFYASADGGATWRALYANCYVRAVWVDPADGNHLVLGPAEDPGGRQGRIEVSHDGGQSWRPVAGPWEQEMVERFYQAGDRLLAVLAGGTLLAGRDQLWQPFLPELTGVTAVTTMA